MHYLTERLSTVTRVSYCTTSLCAMKQTLRCTYNNRRFKLRRNAQTGSTSNNDAKRNSSDLLEAQVCSKAKAWHHAVKQVFNCSTDQEVLDTADLLLFGGRGFERQKHSLSTRDGESVQNEQYCSRSISSRTPGFKRVYQKQRERNVHERRRRERRKTGASYTYTSLC